MERSGVEALGLHPSHDWVDLTDEADCVAGQHGGIYCRSCFMDAIDDDKCTWQVSRSDTWDKVAVDPEALTECPGPEPKLVELTEEEAERVIGDATDAHHWPAAILAHLDSEGVKLFREVKV